MRRLAGLAITFGLLSAAASAVAQSTQATADGTAAQLMNAAFSRAPLVDKLDDPKTFDVVLTRNWPSALSLTGQHYDLRLTPHATFGSSSIGRTAEAGAVLTFDLKTRDPSLTERLDRMGVHDGVEFGQTGRWYIFAAASGRAVGLNVLKDAARGWDQSWSQDTSNALIGDAQLGLGWRRGAMQTSLGYIHREIKGDHMVWGQQARDDSMVAFSLSVKPRR